MLIIDSAFNSISAVDAGKDLDIFKANDLLAKAMGLAGTVLVNNGEGYLTLERA